jgi:tetratricopeptide (TPR) repeat protein
MIRPKEEPAMRKSLIALVALLIALPSAAQITTPPNGDNQKSSVTQYIGPVRVTIDYNSPDVHSPAGENRRGRIWGDLVPWGFIDEQFGTCTQCPWRAGANENTVLTVSHDVEIEGKKLPAGSYGLFMAPGQNEWTLILSKNYTSWGSYSYDPAEDALRVTVKPQKAEYNEWLTYEFTDRSPDRATAALKWEELAVPFTISVPNITDVHLAQIRKELRSSPGFNWQNWNAAAQYALSANRPAEAVEFARTATGNGQQFIGQENFNTLSTLATAQQAAGLAAEARATREKALNHPTAGPLQLHMYARQQMTQGNKDEAVRIWQLNAKRYPNQWPVNVGLMRAYSATGKYKDALRYAKLALPQAPDEINRKNIEDSIKKLGEGKDINS